jgi:VWFA-related protein
LEQQPSESSSRYRAALVFVGIVAPLMLALASPHAQQASTPAPPPTFRGGTALVQVDVVVRDDKGNFVGDLTKGDFQVLEDGKPQTVETFALVGAPASRSTVAEQPRSDEQSAAGAPRILPTPRSMFIFVFDDEHLEPGAFKNVQKAAEDFLQTHFTGNAIGGVVADGGMAGNHLTSDRKELLEAIRAVKPNGHLLFQKNDLRYWPRLLSVEEAEQITAGNSEVLRAAALRAGREAPQFGQQGEDPTLAVQEKAQQITARARPATQRLLQTLAVLLNGLAKFDGPKSVIFLSGGFFTDESWPALQQVVGLAARAHTRIYSIDARGLNFANMADPSAAMANAQGDELGLLLSDADTQNDGPNSLAVDTGGFAIRHTNEFAKAMDQIADDSTTYYLVGYRPTNTDFDGKFRKISVKVSRPGVTVRARRGYLAVPPPATTISTSTPTPPQGPTASPAPAPPSGTPTPAPVSPATSAPSEASGGASAQPAATGSATAPAPAAAPTQPRLRPEGLEHTEELRDAPIGASAASKSATLSPAGTSTSSEASEAWSHYQRGDLESAAKAFAIAAADPAAHPWVHYAYGLTQYGLGQFSSAVAQWEQVRQASPDFEPVYLDLADGYVRSGDRQRALKTLRLAGERWPKDAEIHNALGVIQVTMGVLDEAVKSFQQAVEAAPGDGLGYFNLGKAFELRYFKSRRYVSGTWTANESDRQKAITAYQEYLKIGGPFADSATAELQRLEYLMKYRGPR